VLPARTNRKPDSHRRCPQIDIPHEKFVLSNGLTVIVHEDHSAPLGLRALFEHLMFNGSEHYEKRQGENRPYTKAYELITRAMIPLGHSCDHSVIGSMEDLNAVTLDDVKEWFRTYYGPSNAVLVLAGDITPAQARAKAEKYFGSIQPGAPLRTFNAGCPGAPARNGKRPLIVSHMRSCTGSGTRRSTPQPTATTTCTGLVDAGWR
jgi:predicted Zn-dependent peptidase